MLSVHLLPLELATMCQAPHKCLLSRKPANCDFGADCYTRREGRHRCLSFLHFPQWSRDSWPLRWDIE